MKNLSDILFEVNNTQINELHPNFDKIFKEDLPFAKDVIKDWAKGFIDRDNKFVKEFQTTFNSSFWELYLFASFKELNFSINMEYDRPDFLIEESDGFLVEASIANNTKNGLPEWEKKLPFNEPLDQSIDKSTLRLANTFISKSKKYINSYKNLEHVKSKPYVIAIAPFDAPFTNQQRMQAIQRILYGFDRYITIEWSNEEREILEEIRLESIVKENGSQVPLGYFTNSNHSHVSAVIFSNTATFGKVRALSDDPRIMLFKSARYNENGTQVNESVQLKDDYEEDLLDGLIIFHNPFADYPLINQKLYNSKLAHVTFDQATKELIYSIPHNFLFERFVNTINFGKKDEIDLDIIRKIKKEIEGTFNKNNVQFPYIKY